jgi:hypothetical protein
MSMMDCPVFHHAIAHLFHQPLEMFGFSGRVHTIVHSAHYTVSMPNIAADERLLHGWCAKHS